MKIALAQMNPTVGDFSGNYEQMYRQIQAAQENRVDLIVFPELAISAYPPQDLLERPQFIKDNLVVLEQLTEQANGIAILVGHLAYHESRVGKKLINAASLLVDQKIHYQYAKRLLPNYDVFNEARYFAAGQEPGLVTFGALKLGITICEDIWNDKSYWESPQYSLDPVADLVAADVDVIINLAASPFSYDKYEDRKAMLQASARQHKTPVFFCNLVGGNDSLIFDGASAIINAKGEILAEAEPFEPAQLVMSWDELPHLPPQTLVRDPLELSYEALVVGVQDYFAKCGFHRAVLGLSGGIDSALTATIAVDALGPENVIGLIMPSRYSSKGSVEDALALAAHLNISTEQINIDDLFQSYLNTLEPLFTGQAMDTTEENLQARIRGNLLMAYSNKYGHMVLATGNKSELAVGYCTLYGDMSGGLAVIADVLKTQVFAMARWINREHEIIPQSSIDKAPSAELRANQQDSDSLPEYEILDKILQAYIEGQCSETEIVAQGFDPKLVHDIVMKVNRNEYKRQQMPLGLKISKKAFGLGRRFPLAKKQS